MGLGWVGLGNTRAVLGSSGVAVIGLLAVLAAPAWVAAQPKQARSRPGILLGGSLDEARARVVEVDAALPRGALLRAEARPRPVLSLCSERRALCVSSVDDASETARSACSQALGLLEAAYDRVILGLGLPAPRLDADGPSAGADVYLGLAERGKPLSVGPDAPAVASDVSSGFCVLGRDAVDAFALTHCLVELSLLGLDAAEAPGIRRGVAEYVTQLVELPNAGLLQALDHAQANPQLSVLRRDADALASGGSLFWGYFDAAWGRSTPASLPLALFSVARGRTQDARRDWNNAPDVLDALRAALGSDATAVADWVADYAVGRFFLGSRSDGAHMPGWDWLGDGGRLRSDWVIPYSSLPRNVKGVLPIEPYGIAVNWVELDSVTLGAELSFRVEWEAPVAFKWRVLALDRDGRELSRWDLPYLEKATRLEKTLLNFEAAAALVFIGVNLGAVDPDHPFDPDQQPWEPHAYTLYLAETK